MGKGNHRLAAFFRQGSYAGFLDRFTGKDLCKNRHGAVLQ